MTELGTRMAVRALLGPSLRLNRLSTGLWNEKAASRIAASINVER